MMKHIYLINPAAGRGDSSEALIARMMKAYTAVPKADIPTFYLTQGVGDATRYVHAWCHDHPDEAVRFYACGGDGTLNEVVAGAVEHENASVGLVPAGTGNDFVRSFTSPENFLDFGAQRDGREVALDLVRCNGTYYVNLLNTGFDCEVVVKTGEIKRRPWVPAGMAYGMGVAFELVKKPGVKVEVSVDGGEGRSRELLLCAVGNGACYGGGFTPVPYASLTDGLLDVCLVKNVSRTKFVSLVGSYKRGEHVVPKNSHLMEYFRCRSLKLTFPEMQNVCLDGEVRRMRSCDIEVVPGALRFVLPQGCELRTRPAWRGAEQQPVTV